MSHAYHASPETVAKAPSGCPIVSGFDPLGDDYLEDPYPIANGLRDSTPVFYSPALGHVVLTRMADIERVFLDSASFSSDNVQDPLFPVSPEAQRLLAVEEFNPVAVMSNLAEPDHGRVRHYTRTGFNTRRLRALEQHMRERANAYVDDMLGKGSPCEFVSTLAFPLPAEIIFRFIGFDESDDARVRDWCANRKTFSWARPDPDEQVTIAENMVEYWQYCRDFVALRNRERADDFTSELLAAHEADPDDLSYREVESIVYGLSFAGHDPVTNLLCNMLLCLLPRRDQWDAIVADRALVPNAVEETLRFESSQIAWRRVTTCPVDVGGVDVPTGTPLLLNLAAANRSPEVFDDPDVFDIHRPNAKRHISFGKGIHHCLGNELARMQARIVLEVLTTRLPTLGIADDQSITHFRNVTFRGPESLYLTW